MKENIENIKLKKRIKSEIEEKTCLEEFKTKK